MFHGRHFIISLYNTCNMITIIGTGHVFNLAEPVSFIVKNTWPDAVLIELDVSRYNALMKAQDEGAKPQGEQQSTSRPRGTSRGCPRSTTPRSEGSSWPR